MKKLKPEDLAQLDRERFEALRKSDLIDLTECLRDLCIDLYERLNRNSSNSSKTPSSDDPFSEGKKQQSEDAGDDKCDQSRDEPNDGNSDEDAATAKKEEDETEKRKPGKQIGAPGFGRMKGDVRSERTVAKTAIRWALSSMLGTNIHHYTSRITSRMSPVGLL